jgi:RimJ/RimL family protein N-acetyltransferase
MEGEGVRMNANLLKGELVRLSTGEPELLASMFSRWGRNTDYVRLLDNDPPMLWSAKKVKEWIEKDLDKDNPNEFFFSICKLDDDQMIGFIGLFGLNWSQGETWVGIGVGEPVFWGKGYGTDAMRIVLRYAFTELNLHRVSLGVFGYNTRAQKSYEKAGFRLEGRERLHLNREGERYDLLIMGVLREEWLKVNG